MALPAGPTGSRQVTPSGPTGGFWTPEGRLSFPAGEKGGCLVRRGLGVPVSGPPTRGRGEAAL